jgi:hypothetical protein
MKFVIGTLLRGLSRSLAERWYFSAGARQPQYLHYQKIA